MTMNTPSDTVAWLRRDIAEAMEVKQRLLADDELLGRIAAVAHTLTETLRRGGRVLFAGNGGSAADAQHLAAEIVGRFEVNRPGLPALSLSSDTSMLTAIGNDFGYETVFRRQIEAQSRPGDLFVGITTSGKSPNVLAAFDACASLGVTSVALCGLASGLAGRVDHLLGVPSTRTARVQECHILIGHLLCAHVDRALAQ